VFADDCCGYSALRSPELGVVSSLVACRGSFAADRVPPTVQHAAECPFFLVSDAFNVHPVANHHWCLGTNFFKKTFLPGVRIPRCWFAVLRFDVFCVCSMANLHRFSSVYQRKADTDGGDSAAVYLDSLNKDRDVELQRFLSTFACNPVAFEVVSLSACICHLPEVTLECSHTSQTKNLVWSSLQCGW
jgi:hypothetical protein